MDDTESCSCSFVIKIWLEESARDGDPVRWRGRITQVPTGEQRYFQNLSDAILFIAYYLQKMGVKLPLTWRVNRWVRRFKARKAGRS